MGTTLKRKEFAPAGSKFIPKYEINPILWKIKVCIARVVSLQGAGDKNSTHPLVITSEIEAGRVILTKALVLWEELLKEVILHINALCPLLHMFLKDKCMTVFAG